MRARTGLGGVTGATGEAGGVEVPGGTNEALSKRYPCPHGCTHHTVPSTYPTDCGHYHSPDEWGHREQIHNSAYWAAIGKERP